MDLMQLLSLYNFITFNFIMIIQQVLMYILKNDTNNLFFFMLHL